MVEDPPGIHAAPPGDVGAGQGEAAPKRTVTEPGWLFVRGVIAIGGGSRGIAGLYGAEADAWPIRFFGIGLEYVRGGTTGVSFERTSADHDAFQTARLRLSGRFDLYAGGFALVTLAGGVAHSKRYNYGCSDGSDCNEYPFEGAYKRVEEITGPSGAMEVGVYHRMDGGHVGLVIRGDTSKFSSTFTLGPAFGVEF
jgi:hypothetical protein